MKRKKGEREKKKWSCWGITAKGTSRFSRAWISWRRIVDNDDQSKWCKPRWLPVAMFFRPTTPHSSRPSETHFNFLSAVLFYFPAVSFIGCCLWEETNFFFSFRFFCFVSFFSPRPFRPWPGARASFVLLSRLYWLACVSVCLREILIRIALSLSFSTVNPITVSLSLARRLDCNRYMGGHWAHFAPFFYSFILPLMNPSPDF